MDTQMSSTRDRKPAFQNTQSFIGKTSRMLLLAMFLVVAISLATTGAVSASNTSDTNASFPCKWMSVNGHWIKYCDQYVTNTTGHLWMYDASSQTPWLKYGHFDATYLYIFDFRGGYSRIIERATWKTFYQTNCGWIDVNTTCSAGTNYYGFIGGSSYGSMTIVPGNSSTATSTSNIGIVSGATAPIDPLIANALAQMNHRWLAPTCDTRYYYC